MRHHAQMRDVNVLRELEGPGLPLDRAVIHVGQVVEGHQEAVHGAAHEHQRMAQMLLYEALTLAAGTKFVEPARIRLVCFGCVALLCHDLNLLHRWLRPRERRCGNLWLHLLPYTRLRRILATTVSNWGNCIAKGNTQDRQL